MIQQFHTRTEAGRLLAERLLEYAHQSNVRVIAISGAGVPVAAEVAHALDAPLDLIHVHRLALPGCADVSLGAVVHGNQVVLNEDIVSAYEVPNSVLAELTRVAKARFEREERQFEHAFAAHDLQGCTAIIVDDGVASGTMLRAALGEVRRAKPQRIVVAVPVMTSTACLDTLTEADEVLTLTTLASSGRVRDWYEEALPTADVAA